jgi:hypothetical protein
MSSSSASGQSRLQRRGLERELWEAQDHRCFMREEEIPNLAGCNTEVVRIALSSEEKDDNRNNLAIVHSACGRIKQDSDLRVARTLARLGKIRKEQYAPSVSSIVDRFGGAKYSSWLMEGNRQVNYSLLTSVTTRL